MTPRAGRVRKPGVAFFDFTCCEGCQLDALNLTEDQIMDLLRAVEIVEFREVKTGGCESYDISFVEGSIAREEDADRLRDIRERSKTVIALGACAHIGGVNCLRNLVPADAALQEVYGDAAGDYDILDTVLPIDAVIDVDYVIPGCPINPEEFARTVADLLLGKEPRLPRHPVCVECKMAGNLCVFEKGQTCVGPITRAGCKAICVTAGRHCWGCRGLVDDPNIDAQREILDDAGLTVEQILEEFRIYFSCGKEAL
ncbi:MAG: NADH:ubiquinone oxidoreductase [Candidatus Bipolaricaulota bacterium]|nr:MAG: NADH:ubiquinone oxidoreductase [Candidatus Bipolaricaulota bacterium]